MGRKVHIFWCRQMHVDEKQKPNGSKDNNDDRVRNRVKNYF